MAPEYRRLSIGAAAGAVALGLVLGHIGGTAGDHDRIKHLQQQVRQLDRTDGMQDAGLQGTYDGLNERLSALERRERAARASRSRHTAVPSAAPQRPAGAAAWAATADAVRVANCESADLAYWPYSDGSRYLGGDKGVHLRDQPTYTGKWQIGPSEWADWGGLRFVAAPWRATEAEQDETAYIGWKARGWQPWVCARKLGIR